MTHRRGEPSEEDREARDQELFERIASEYAAKDLHRACRAARRHRATASLDAVPFSGKPDLLEVGCGAGFSAEYLEGRFDSYTGIDYSRSLIQEARARHASDTVSFTVADGKEFSAFSPFDVILMIGVLHHVPDKDHLIRSLLRSLKPGGWLVANEPQPGNPLVRLSRKVRGKVDPSYSEEQEQLPAEELTALFRRQGLEGLRVRWQGYLSTPFAEVPLRPERAFEWIARCAVAIDRILERSRPPLVARWSWNCVVAGRKPSANGTTGSPA